MRAADNEFKRPPDPAFTSESIIHGRMPDSASASSIYLHKSISRIRRLPLEIRLRSTLCSYEGGCDRAHAEIVSQARLVDGVHRSLGWVD